VVVLAFALLVPQVAHAQARVLTPGVALPEVQVVQDQQQSAGGAGAAQEPQAAPVVPITLSPTVNGSENTTQPITSTPPPAATNPTIPIDACVACASGIGKTVAPTAWDKWGKYIVEIGVPLGAVLQITLQELHSDGKL
jgi:hypothetical protein